MAFSFQIRILILLIALLSIYNQHLSEKIEYDIEEIDYFESNTDISLYNNNFLHRELTVVTPSPKFAAYTSQSYYMIKIKSTDITVHDIKIINGMSALVSNNYLIHSCIIDNRLVLYVEYISDSTYLYLTEYSIPLPNDSFTLDSGNSSFYTASASSNYLGNGEFLLFYTKSFSTNRYNIYSYFIKFNVVTETFETFSYDSFNNLPLVFSANERADISDYTTDTSYYYTNVLQTLYIKNSLSESYTIILSISIYE